MSAKVEYKFYVKVFDRLSYLARYEVNVFSIDRPHQMASRWGTVRLLSGLILLSK